MKPYLEYVAPIPGSIKDSTLEAIYRRSWHFDTFVKAFENLKELTLERELNQVIPLVSSETFSNVSDDTFGQGLLFASILAALYLGP